MMSRRVKRALFVALLLLGVGVLLAAPALAEGGSPAGAGVLDVLDRQDSRGIWVSQYQLYVDKGTLVTSFDNFAYSMMLIPLWELYRWGVSATSILLDQIITLSWVKIFIAPVDFIARQIRTQILSPLGMTGWNQGGMLGVILTLAGVVAAWKFYRHGVADGLRHAATSAVMAALAVGVFASPFAAVVGGEAALSKPLRYSQAVGADTASLIVAGTVPTSDVNAGTVQTPKLGQIFVDALIRPVHQGLNFGGSIDRDEGGKCIEAYDTALKEGPYDSGDSKPRDKIGGCNKAYKDHASAPSATWLFTLLMLCSAGFNLVILVLLFALFLAYAIFSLVVSCFRLMVTSLWGIIPGASRGPVLRDLVGIGTNIVYIAVTMGVLAIVMAVIKKSLELTNTWPLLIQYTLLCLMLILGWIALILNWWWHRKGKASLWRRIAGLAGVAEGKPSMLTRAIDWAKKPARGTETERASTQPSSGTGGPAKPSTIAGRMLQMRQQTSDSNGAMAGRLAVKGVKVGANVAATMTGAKSAVLAVKGLRTAGKLYSAVRAGTGARGTTGSKPVDAGARAVAAGVGLAERTPQTYRGMRAGAKRATTGSRAMDQVLAVVAKGHNGAEKASERAKKGTSEMVLNGVLHTQPKPVDGTGDRASRTTRVQQVPGAAKRRELPMNLSGMLAKPDPTTKTSSPPVPAEPVARKPVKRPDPVAVRRGAGVARPPKAGSSQTRRKVAGAAAKIVIDRVAKGK